MHFPAVYRAITADHAAILIFFAMIVRCAHICCTISLAGFDQHASETLPFHLKRSGR